MSTFITKNTLRIYIAGLLFIFFSCFFVNTALGSYFPLPFIENRGQIKDDSITYYVTTVAGTVYITKKGDILYSLSKHDGVHTVNSSLIKESLSGSTITEVKGDEASATKIHCLFGKNPEGWIKNISAYNMVHLPDVYKGIDLKVRINGNSVEKVFFVQPGGDPSQIQLTLEGVFSSKINRKGDLELETNAGIVNFTKPLAYQNINGEKKKVEVAYKLLKNGYSFKIGSYDDKETLIIDPVLAATFIGGNDEDYITGLAFDSSGNVYIAGSTNSLDFPGTGSGSADSSIKGIPKSEGFVMKLNSSLSSILAATFIGGNSNETIEDIVVDGEGNIYVAGSTESRDFPGITPGSADSTSTGNSEGFIAKLNSDLSSILAATFLGGNNDDSVKSIAIQDLENIYVTGYTGSNDFPGINAGSADKIFNNAEGTFQGAYEGFIIRLDSALSSILAASFIGGEDDDMPFSIALNLSGEHPEVYVSGWTKSSGFPGTGLGSADNTIEDYGIEGFVARLNYDLSSILSATYLGGSDDDVPQALALDSTGNLYVTGYTYSSDFPGIASNAADPTFYGYNEGFISKLSPDLSSIAITTFLGGSDNDVPFSLAIDSTGSIFVSGYTQSSDFPGVSSNSADNIFGPYYEGFVSKLDSGLTSINASTYLGGSNYDNASILGVDPADNIYAAGWTYSRDFSDKTISGADSIFTGPNESFVVKINSALSKAAIGYIKTRDSIIPSGDIYTLCWDRTLGTSNFKLMYSINNGRSWKTIKNGLNASCYDWEVPLLKKNESNCLVKAIEYSQSRKKAGENISRTTFSIEVASILSPHPNEILVSGAAHNISWKTNKTKKAVAAAYLYYNQNGKKKWKLISSIPGNLNSFRWIVPAVATEKSTYKIKLILKDSRGKTVATAFSNNSFTIKPQ